MIEESELLVSSRRIWSRKWHPALVFLPGKFHGQRSLAGPWGLQSWTQLNTYTHTHTHTHNRRIQYAELLKEVLVPGASLWTGMPQNTFWGKLLKTENESVGWHQ